MVIKSDTEIQFLIHMQEIIKGYISYEQHLGFLLITKKSTISVQCLWNLVKMINSGGCLLYTSDAADE